MRHKHCRSTGDFQYYFNLLVILLSKLLNVHNTERHILIQNIECYSLREGSEAREDGGERGLVTGVRSGWGRASRSMRTKYHICLQFIVEFGRVSVNTDALRGEAHLPTEDVNLKIVEVLTDDYEFEQRTILYRDNITRAEIEAIVRQRQSCQEVRAPKFEM